MRSALTPSAGGTVDGISPEPAGRPVVCVQGLGFVGAAMTIAVASVRDNESCPAYSVIGVDLPTATGLARIEALNTGTFPFATVDAKVVEKTRQAHEAGNLTACADPGAFRSASVIVVDVALNVLRTDGHAALDLEMFRSAIRSVGGHMRPDALVIIETTVPPGTTARVVAPALKQELAHRGLPTDEFLLAHSYERVMPGSIYFDSIVNMWRVYAGMDSRSAKRCGEFLASVINVAEYPLTRLSNTTSSEIAKILENTYRGVTIALMEEWGSFAEKVGVDLFEVVNAIRLRDTHSNMRTPGFGVGGYCLTKDPLMGELAAKEIFNFDHVFPFASLAVATNDYMPRRALEKLRSLMEGSLAAKRILLLGVSYREDVGDTRYSPSETFYTAATDAGAQVTVRDPLVAYWPEKDIHIPRGLPPAAGQDAVLLAAPHKEYKNFDYCAWLDGHHALFFDAFNVLSSHQRKRLRASGCRVESIGRGVGL